MAAGRFASLSDLVRVETFLGCRIRLRGFAFVELVMVSGSLTYSCVLTHGRSVGADFSGAYTAFGEEIWLTLSSL